MEIPQVVEIFRKWGLSSKTEIKKILKMKGINDISVDVVNKFLIKMGERKNIKPPVVRPRY